MRKDYGIRNKETGEVIETFYDPIEAKAKLPDTDHYEVVERTIENEYAMFPDGKSYIVGVKEGWQEYKE